MHRWSFVIVWKWWSSRCFSPLNDEVWWPRGGFHSELVELGRAYTLPLHVVFDVTQEEVHYLFTWMFGEITEHRWEWREWPRVALLLGSSARSSGEFGTKIRVLACSQDSLPDIRNIQSDNLRVVEWLNRTGKSDIYRLIEPKYIESKYRTSSPL